MIKKRIEKERLKIVAKIRLDEIEKEYMEKLKNASMNENIEQIQNYMFELNILRNYYKKNI